MGIFFNNNSEPEAKATPTTPASNQASAAGLVAVQEPQTVSSLFGTSSIDASKLSPMLGLNEAIEYISLEEGGKNASTAFGYIPSRNASDDIMYGTGATYLTGLIVGGLYGAREGLKATKGLPLKVRYNGFLNGCTLRGPFVGNYMGILAFGYNCVNHLAMYNGAPDNRNTSIGSGVFTGMLFRSTAGLRASLISGVICGTAVAIWKTANDAYNNRDVDYSPQSMSA